jgi:hypothetical protein
MTDAARGIRYVVLIATLTGIVAIVYVLSGTPSEAHERLATPHLPRQFANPDQTTRDIRSSNRLIYRVEEPRGSLKRYGRVVAKNGGGTFVSIESSKLKSPVHSDAKLVDTTIILPGKSFDPIATPVAGTVPSGLERAPMGDGYYIVQLGTVATDDILESLKTAGVEILQYVPHQAFFVYGSGEAVARAASHSRVRWVGEFRPEYKLTSRLLEQIDAARGIGRNPERVSELEMASKRTAIFDVAVFKRASLKNVASQLSQTGTVRGVIDLPENFFNVIRVEVTLDAVSAIAQIPEVIRVDPWSRPTKEDERSAQIVAGNYTSQTSIAPPGYDPLSQFGVDGQNVTVAVVDDGVGIPGDGGFYITSGNAKDGPLRGATTGALGHGHLQASIIAGTTPFSVLDPLNYNYGLGVAPNSNIVNIPFLKLGYAGTEANTANDAVTTTGPNNVASFISNNSWGNGLNGNAYDSYTAQFDGLARDASSAPSIDPLLFVFSAGNASFSGLTRPHVAKNIIATGATENLRANLDPSADNIDDLYGGSSRGPAADGRVKPDILAPGKVIAGGRSGTNPLSGDIDPAHRWSVGTSHAAPHVAGAAALFTQFWKNGHSGSNPSPALVKAALINGAQDANGLDSGNAIPNADEGWGRVYLKGVLNTGTAISYVNESNTLFGTGASRTYGGTVADNAKPIRVTLVWTDPPAVGDPALVNDLDLEVTVGGNTYKGNVLSGGLSTTGGTADDVNNVENVFLPAGLSGPITVRVAASAINGNGVLGNSDATDQHFALVVYNANLSTSPAASLSIESPVILTGNALIEPNECNRLNVPLTNSGDTAATVVSAALTTTTPGVSVELPTLAYPSIAANGGIQNGLAPYLVSTDSSVSCFTNIDFTLTVIYSGGPSPVVFNFSLPVGQPADQNYSFNATSGTISAIGTLIPGSDTDDALLSFAVPFSFSVYGTNVSAGSNIKIGTNGFIRIDNAGSGTSPTNDSLPSAGADLPASLPVLFPYWDDLDMRPTTTSGGGIFTEVTGAPGSQTLKIEWRARHFDSENTLAPSDTNFAVYFHEGTNHFEYVYGQSGVGSFAGGNSATVGVQAAATGSLFTEFSVNASSLSSGLKLNATQTAAVCSIGGGVCFSTAAPATLSGRVVDRYGRGLGKVGITLSTQGGPVKSVVTNSFGYYRLEGLHSGTSYTVSATSFRYVFSSRLVQMADDLDGFDFVAEN